MTAVAFLTMDTLDGFVCYDNLVSDILTQRGISIDDVSWRADGVDWNRYELVIVRSPWDYQQDPGRFLSVLERIHGSRARLLNSLEIVRWNIRKTYLRDLEQAGVTIVPTRWLNSPSIAQLRGLFETEDCFEIVMKPVVGANADNVIRLRPDSPLHVLQKAESVFRDDVALVQPFVDSVIHQGEISLIFFGGEYSHSVVKIPKPADFRVQEEHGGQIATITPSRDVIAFAQTSLANLPEATLYARADIVFLENNQPALMELELIEPSLYLSFDSGAPLRFAEKIEEQLRA